MFGNIFFINVLVTQTKLADSKIAFSNGREVTFQLCHNQMLINFCWTDIYYKFSRLMIINPPLKSMHVVKQVKQHQSYLYIYCTSSPKNATQYTVPRPSFYELNLCMQL